jgi:hypothetical protein
MAPGDRFVALKIGEESQLLRPVSSGVIPVKEKGVTAGYYERAKRKVLKDVAQQTGNLLLTARDKKTSII